MNPLLLFLSYGFFSVGRPRNANGAYPFIAIEDAAERFSLFIVAVFYPLLRSLGVYKNYYTTGISTETVTDRKNTTQPIIMPSLLAAPFDRLGQAIRNLEQAGVGLFHYDVMDGHFVPNLSGSPHILEDLEPHLISQFDVHLMVDNPERVIPWFNLQSVRSISIHVEIPDGLERNFETIRSLGKLAGVVINPPTPQETLDSYLGSIDRVLVMTVHPGLGGQPLIQETLSKIEYCARRRDELGLDYSIQVDGGVKQDTIRAVYDAGANEIVSGSAIFNHESPGEAWRQLNRTIGNTL